MDPYQVLGIPPYATEEQIKTAYRRLVKEYHPDRNKSETAAVIIQRVNEAYEVLTDPGRNQRHQHETGQTEQQRAYEEHKAAFLKKKREQAKRAYEEKLIRDKRRFKLARMAAIPMLVVGLIFVVDQLLPPDHYSETSERGWQRVYNASRSRYGGGGSGTRHNYMRTAHFKRLEVPNRVLLDYDFYINPGILNIDASPLLGIPKTISVETKEHVFKFEALGTPYSASIPLHYLLFITGSLAIWRRQFSYGNRILVTIPLALFCILMYLWLV